MSIPRDVDPIAALELGQDIGLMMGFGRRRRFMEARRTFEDIELSAFLDGYRIGRRLRGEEGKARARRRRDEGEPL